MSQTDILLMLAIILASLLIIWGFIIGPILKKKAQQKSTERLDNKINNLKAGDKVLLSAGIRGIFIKTKGEVVYVQVDSGNNTTLKVDRRAIMGVYK